MTLPPFQTLLEAHGAEIYRYLVATAGAAEAEDCFQETWIAALRAYPRLRRGGNLRAWLYRIAQNKAVDAHRSRRRRAVPVAAPTGANPAPGPEPAEPELWEAVRALPPKQRTAVYCRSVLGMPYQELADLLECSQDAARRSVHEGLKRLREEWTS